jgi:hypothetical protein
MQTLALQRAMGAVAGSRSMESLKHEERALVVHSTASIAAVISTVPDTTCITGTPCLSAPKALQVALAGLLEHLSAQHRLTYTAVQLRCKAAALCVQ